MKKIIAWFKWAFEDLDYKKLGIFLIIISTTSIMNNMPNKIIAMIVGFIGYYIAFDCWDKFFVRRR